MTWMVAVLLLLWIGSCYGTTQLSNMLYNLLIAPAMLDILFAAAGASKVTAYILATSCPAHQSLVPCCAGVSQAGQNGCRSGDSHRRSGAQQGAQLRWLHALHVYRGGSRRTGSCVRGVGCCPTGLAGFAQVVCAAAPASAASDSGPCPCAKPHADCIVTGRPTSRPYSAARRQQLQKCTSNVGCLAAQTCIESPMWTSTALPWNDALPAS